MKFKCIEAPKSYYQGGVFVIGNEYETGFVDMLSSPPDALFIDENGDEKYEHIYFFEPADDEAKELLTDNNYNRSKWECHRMLTKDGLDCLVAE